MTTTEKFDFEKLEVWRRAVLFGKNVIEVAEKIDSERKHFRLVEQIEAASTSVSMNIAEGKGRHSKKEYIQFLFYARGSIFETVTLLEIFKMKNWIDEADFFKIRLEAIEITKMLNALIGAIKRSMDT